MATVSERVRIFFEARGLGGLKSDSRQAASSIARIGVASDVASRKMEGLKFAAQSAGGRVGELAGRAENLGRSLGALGPVGGGAALAAAGIAVATAAMVKMTLVATDAIQDMEALRDTEFGFSSEQADRIEAAHVALQGIGASVRLLSVEIAANFAPQVQFLGQATIAAALATRDLFTAWAAGESIATTAINGIGRAFKPLVDAQAGYLSLWLALREEWEFFNGGVPTGADFGDLRDRIRSLNDLSAALEGGMAPAMAKVIEMEFGGYWDEAGQFMTDAVPAINDTADGIERIADGVDRAFGELAQGKMDAFQVALQKIKDRAIEAQETAAQLAMTEAEDAAARNQALDEAANSTLDWGQATAWLGAQAAVIPGLLKEGGRAAFEASRATALAGVAFNTAEAITRAIAMFGPPPSPVGIAAIGAAGAIGAAQVAAIAAQPPPKFHTGGIIPADAPSVPGGSPNERMFIGEVGEQVLTRDQQRSGSTTVVNLRLGPRDLKQVVVGSGLLNGVQRKRGIGQRRYRSAP